ncbi:serine hydrolase domain-containing protein [Phreatobacter cathodiphilus]|uniref:Serine hydrolase n=1 Tax=Phreatobacter cathodiphilus TaxID=1868589 RepID=A0A2S0NAW8_9HYPH|nr:serine hydrolase domain-containing protein [Phreatobacter cathodiphilus]AVO45314.1 serine hydrolase [Phreatobacter cathodiphilus]
MDDWLRAALDYVPRWIDFQVQHLDQPGCSIAVAHKGEIVLEEAFGTANLSTGEALTPRHRFRVASHSKTFTAAGILKLKDRGLLRLDDAAGTFVQGLHEEAAAATVQQLLSHSAGYVRDGADSGYFADLRPFLTAAQLREELALAPPLPAGQRFKYSNHGYGILGLIIEAVTGEHYRDWIMREIVGPAGLSETYADIGLMREGTLASGHSTRLPFGKRLVIPGNAATADLASATGFVSTAADLARFFSQLAPSSPAALLSPAARRDMTRRHWRDNESTLERYYGLGTISGSVAGWDWFGHSGSFAGTLSRTAVFPAQDIAISVLTNAIDGPAQLWVDGIAHILKTFEKNGPPAAEVADWAGRWWTLWGAVDLVPVGNKVLACPPALNPPLSEVSEITVTGLDAGLITRAPGFNQAGEAATRMRDAEGEISQIWLGGVRLVGEFAFAEEAAGRYGA